MTSGYAQPKLPLSGFAVFESIAKYQEELALRLARASHALDSASIPYAVCGGNAVAYWVALADPSGVRPTQDIDLLLARNDLDRAASALAAVGFVHRHAAGVDLFTDGPTGGARQGVHIIFAGEKVRPDHPVPAPPLADDQRVFANGLYVVLLATLVRMKLTSFRHKDITHLQDMLLAGLLDESMFDRIPPELHGRLREVLDNPEG